MGLEGLEAGLPRAPQGAREQSAGGGELGGLAPGLGEWRELGGPGPGEVGVGSWVAWPRAAQPHCPVSTLGPNSGLTRKPGLFPAQ